ncbi:DUF3696 domain-containing protein [Ensifer sp. NM-2]|uniref:DUF3696 domain-containing protein n=1 Tax=Ensifer sp. NM-2 TaxID=2109730 RepID=UPI0011B2553B|nr:DUF3696 domain-containing protein [Ensifer sp. NM-2]
MLRFGLNNVRRLKNTSLVDLRPITILVGRNSSGKSTFLRTFPLLRQSLMTRTSSPILWYGDLVDFGEFEDVVHDNRSESRISFSFGLDNVTTEPSFVTLDGGGYGATQKRAGPVDVELFVSGRDRKTKLDGFSFRLGNPSNVFDVSIDDSGSLSGISRNGESVMHLFDGAIVSFQLGSIFPNILLRSKEQEEGRYFYQPFQNPVHDHLASLLRPHVDRRLRDDQIGRFAINLLMMDEFSISELEGVKNRTGTRSFLKILTDMAGKNTRGLREKVQQMYEVNQFFSIVGATFSSLKTKISSTLYIGPVRARSERYYRYQDLAVSEIDPDGKNFPMFLTSLTSSQRTNFSKWVKERFGYGVEVVQNSGHISIKLANGDKTTNIVDNGYGISQVLPVLGQIWWASRGAIGRRRVIGAANSSMLLIEQPELHLHPAHQALLADAVVGERVSSTPRDPDVSFIIETHSEAFVNRLGALIAEGKVRADDVQILVFEQDDEDEKITSVRVSRFTSGGTLTNWPYGFFQPTV